MINDAAYRLKAQKLRLSILDAVYHAGSGHLGGSFSSVEIMLSLYGEVMRYRPDEPDWCDRDRFLLSKGHAAPVLYATLAEYGFFPQDELKSLRQWGSMLQGHPDMRRTPGVDFSSGSLGQGLSIGLGMAHALSMRNSEARVFVLLGDGELNEGQIWEAAMAANKMKPKNLIAIVDRNGVQLDGTSDDIMPMEPLADKWRAFGWTVLEADGHSVSDMTRSLTTAVACGAPCVMIANTVKGKGVSFMEGRHEWHGGVLNDKQYEQARNELAGHPI